MGRACAIAVVVALLIAPMTLFAAAWKCACAPGYCTMAHCNAECPMMQYGRHAGKAKALRCDCMRYPIFGALAPLTQMLPAPAPAKPEILFTSSAAIPSVKLILPGFVPSAFHPPRS